MKYLSVCSGIEAATVAWHPLGWKPEAFSEIEKFPSQVLKHHYPNVPNLGDMTKFEEWNLGTIDLLVGGTPCQSFSVAGLRKGLDDPRGNLMLTYGAIANRFRPRWLVWENVPGVLSSNGGRDFGSFLGMLGKLGYGWAYRVLDAQYFGVAQRRRRVFVVGYLGNWRRAAAVLFERHSLQGNPAPSREARQSVAGTIGSRASSGGGFSTDFECAGELQPVAARAEVCPTVTNGPPFSRTGNERVEAEALVTVFGPRMQSMAVRRLTPVECERLQGFPDNYTNIPNAADGPRYKALGNSMAVPVMAWIGKRIQEVDAIRRADER